jgi:hypothetical protein
MQFCFRPSSIFQSISPHRRISVLVENSDGLLSNKSTFQCCAVLMSKMLNFSFLKFCPPAVKYIDKCVQRRPAKTSLYPIHVFCYLHLENCCRAKVQYPAVVQSNIFQCAKLFSKQVAHRHRASKTATKRMSRSGK